MITYTKWADIPENLATKTTVHKKGLRLLQKQKPSAWIKTCRNTYALYDLNLCVPKRERSEKQIAAFENMLQKSECQNCHCTPIKTGDSGLCRTCERNQKRKDAARNSAIEDVCHLYETDFVILDLETTGLEPESKIVEIAIISSTGETLINTLVDPEIPIPPEASAVHGIQDHNIFTAPLFEDITHTIKKAIDGKTVVIYNAEFDLPILKAHGVEIEKSCCAMKIAARYIGSWSEKYQNWRWFPMWEIAWYLDLPESKSHRALADVKLTLAILQKIKNS